MASGAKRSDMPETCMREKQRFGLTAWIGVLFGILIGIGKSLIWSKGAFSSEVFGYAVAGVLIPGGIAYAIAGREKVRNGNRFALWFILVSVFFLLLEVSQAKH
jgi:hypothetical protein